MTNNQYLKSITYENIKKLVEKDVNATKIRSERALEKLSNTDKQYDLALQELIDKNDKENFIVLYFYVIDALFKLEYQIYYSLRQNWIFYVYGKVDKYFNYIYKIFDVFMQEKDKIDCVYKNDIVNMITMQYITVIPMHKWLIHKNQLIQLFDDNIKMIDKKSDYLLLKQINFNRNMLDAISGNEKYLEEVKANLDDAEYLKVYWSYLKINQKNDEILMTFFRYNDRIKLDGNNLILIIDELYKVNKYRTIEDLIINRLVEDGNRIIAEFFDLIKKKFPKLNFQRIVNLISYENFRRKKYNILSILAQYSDDVKLLNDSYSNEFDILSISTNEIVNSRFATTYAIILVDKLNSLVFNTFSYFSNYDEFCNLIELLLKTKYAFVCIHYIYNRFEKILYGSTWKKYKEVLISALEKCSFDQTSILDLTTTNEYLRNYYIVRTNFAYDSSYIISISKYIGDEWHYDGILKDNPKDLSSNFLKGKTDLFLIDIQTRNNYFKYYQSLDHFKKEWLLKKESADILKLLIDNMKQNDVIVTNEPVHLMPILEIVNEDLNKQTVVLSLKIGINKFYMVKNLEDFIERIINKEVYQYGKGLSIYHNIENFDDESKMIINYLHSIYNNKDLYDKKIGKSINITTFFIDELIKKYVNNYIVVKNDFDSENYFVSEKNYESHIQIKDEILKLEDNSIVEIIYGSKYDYIIKANVIETLDANNDMRSLIRFCFKNPEFNLHYVQNTFLEQVYNRIDVEVEADESFKQNVKAIDLHIETYFTMEDDKIYCDTKYLINNQEISYQDLIEKKKNSYKIVKYQNILEKLGFVDNLIDNEQKSILFLSSDLSELKKISDIYLSENIQKMQVVKLSKPKPYLGYDTNMLSICLKNFSYTNDELYKILQAIKKKQRFVKLHKDVIIDIDAESARVLTQTVSDFALNEKKLSETQQVPLYYSLKALNQSEEFSEYEIDDFLKKILNDIANYKNSEYRVPKDLENIMRNYQVDGFKWMKILSKYHLSGILADDMGLGKTLQIVSLIKDSTIKKPSLIICPKSLSFNWLAEFNKWDAEEEVKLIVGNANERINILSNINSKTKTIYITSYDSLKNDLEYYEKIKFEFIILDEAQYIKNHSTLKAQSVKKLKGEHKFVLTGTPIENSIVDLWSIFDFLMPNYLYNYTHFKNMYESEIVQNKNDEVKNNLIRKITPFILRRTKEDVLKDLPEKIETIQYVSMDESTKQCYEAELLKLKDLVDDSNAKMQVLASFTRLRQLCVDPSLYIDNFNGISPKLELTMNLIDEFIENNHKVIIFSQFTSVFEKLQKMLSKKNIAYFTLTGKTKADERVKMADKFNDNKSLEKVFLVSLKAGGTGLNITGADIVIHLDPWWNVAAEEQATGRAHRLGQKNIVNVIKIVCLDSIEQKVIELQNIKKRIVSDIIADNDNNIQKLSSDDLKILLS